MTSTLNCMKWGRHAIGISYVILVVFLWITSSELTQSIFENKDFNHPFFLTYFSTSLFMIYLPFFIRLFINEYKAYLTGNTVDKSLYTSLSPKQSLSHQSYSSLSPISDDINNDNKLPSIECVEYINDENNQISDDDNDQTDEPEHKQLKHNNTDIIELNNDNLTENNCECQLDYNSICIASLHDLNKLSLIDTIKLSLIFCPIWFLMNYTFNISLNMTSVASNTILSTMSGPFSLLLSRCLLNTKLSLCNSSGVLITLLGAIFIGYLDEKNNNTNGTVWGDILALLSAFIYGCYVTLIKYKIKNESSVNMFLFFGLLGFINVCLLWPFLIFLDLIKFEIFQWPSNNILLLLTLNGLISVGSDYFWAQSILYTSPVVATVGLSLMMPVAMIADEIFRHQRHSILYWSGAVFVMIGFILVNLDFKHQVDEENELEQKETQHEHDKTTLTLQQT